MPRRSNPIPVAVQREQLYQAIGEAITAWAAVEDRLCDLFAYFITGDARSFPAKAAFHAVINFNSKLAMTGDAAEWRINGAALKTWGTLSNRLGRKAKQRNDIVHFSLIRSDSFPRGQMGLFLSPSLQNVTAHTRSQTPTKLTPKDIRQRGVDFQVLARQLSEFAVQIGAIQPTPLPEFLSLLLGRDADDNDIP